MQWPTVYFQCSVTCGTGRSQREVLCVSEAGMTRPSSECDNPKPRNTKRCTLHNCPQWIPTRWGKVGEMIYCDKDNCLLFNHYVRSSAWVSLGKTLFLKYTRSIMIDVLCLIIYRLAPLIHAGWYQIRMVRLKLTVI